MYLSSNILIKSIYFNRNQSLERDLSRAQQEVAQLKSVVERLRLDKAEFEEQLNEVSKDVTHRSIRMRKLKSKQLCKTAIDYHFIIFTGTCSSSIQ